MSSSSHKNDNDVLPLYRQGGSLSKVGYFKAGYFKIGFDDLFRDFLKAYWHVIPSGVRVKRVKDGSSPEPYDGARRAIKFHPYYFVFGFTFPMSRFFQEVLCSMRYSEFGSTPKTSSNIRKVHVALGIPSEYHEWRWLLSPLHRKKSGSHLERLATMKSDKVFMPAKVTLQPDPSVADTNSSAEKNEIARAGNHEKSTKFASGEVAEICALLKPDLLEDMNVCAKFVNGVKGVIGPSFFAKHTTEYRRTVLLAMIQKTAILVAEPILLGQEDTKAIKEIQDLKRAIFEFRSAAYAKDEKLIAAYNQVIYFMKVVDRLEPQVLELQGALKINDNLKKKVEELQRSQADFYKMGYVDHLFGRLSDFKFSGKNFETFFISLKDLLAFNFESSIGEVVGDVGQTIGSLPKTVSYLSALGNSFRFGLAIALSISRHGHVLLDAILLKELRQIFAHELLAVVDDNGLRNAKSPNDVPPYKALYVRLSRGNHKLCFYPFGEIAHCMNNQGLICGCSSLAGSASIDL
ncbi:hypothetical protein D8674_039600 [Pyrus ussuriensis x Pyrus communis]|uniref:Uncharacterized protein n=1 Tax=Pyrus ussuriensis x Pyrus communis TaxID=2448454 RepID=A0A5N5FMM2_9ROSA|nr:hypothetical protein D8674_039600 [Pyrus ussuriensis x Pyrus communis]